MEQKWSYIVLFQIVVRKNVIVSDTLTGGPGRMDRFRISYEESHLDNRTCSMSRRKISPRLLELRQLNRNVNSSK